MNISVTFRNMEAEEWLKEYADKKLVKIEKYIDKPIDANVVFSVEKFRNMAEVKLMAKGINLNGKEEAKDMALALDAVVDKLERQLKKYKEKIRNHKDNGTKAAAFEESEYLSSDISESEPFPRLIETRKITLKPMTVEEAIMEIEDGNNFFIIYRDASSEEINVIYRREDGNYVLMETVS